ITTTATTGLDYRTDDHGNDTATADPLAQSSSTTSLVTFDDNGIIERTGDVDYFSFTVDGLGGIAQFDISPFTNGPNLDILATLRRSDGTVIATSNPYHDIAAGGQTLGNPDGDGGWLLSNGDYTDTFNLQAGTYYVTVTGTGRAPDLTN